MRSGWRIGSLFGIPLLLDSSWFFILLLVTFRYGAIWQHQEWEDNVAWIAGFAMAVLLFVSVLLHELGHSLVARSQGIKVSSITLFMFGGIASIDQESKTPSQAFQVAIAGPAISFGLFVILELLYRTLPPATPLALMTRDLAAINGVLALFNMIPGLPLDGGQVLKAAVWKATGSRIRGVRWSARIGYYLGWFAIIFSVIYFLKTFNLLVLWLALVGWFVINNALAYSRITDLQEVLLNLKAADAMSHEFRVVDANLTLRQFMDKYLLLEEAQVPAFFSASDGRYRGMISLDDLRQLERSEWETQSLQSITRPLADIATVTETTTLIDVIEQLEVQELHRITVLSPAGSVAGVIDRGDIVRATVEKLRIPVSENIIKQIKEEGSYPPGLQLWAIARAAKE
jgi:Zn-dependent protease